MGDQEVKKKHSEKRKGKNEDSATLNEDLDRFKQKRRKSDDNPIDKKKKRRKETIPEPTVTELMAVDDVTPIEKKKKKHSKSSITLAEPPMISLQEMAKANNDIILSSEKVSPTNTEKKKKKRKRDEDSVALPHPLPAAVASDPPPPQSDISSYMTKHSIKIHTKIDLPPILSFAHLPPSIPTPLRDALNEFSEPTPVQACCWPVAFAGQDVVGIAETGSGKTLAFGLPALAHILNLPSGDSNPISVLVIAPTRELAIQTHETLYKLGAPLGIGSVAVFGGVSKKGQVRLLQATSKQKNQSANGVRKEGGGVSTRMRIIVGTPGRILDLVNDGTCDLSAVSYLVLDEADRMLDKGFENDIRRIIGFTRDGKEGRQTMMFSATWPEAVRRLADSFMRDAVRVTVGSDDLTANSKVEQIVEVFDDARSKDSRLLSHLRTHLPSKSKNGSSLASADRILIFALYKKEAARLEQTLYRAGYSVGALHGDMHQSARMDALDKFRDGSTTLLVATDVAARGLDIPEVRLVVNYTFPLTVEDYVHRIGRTGRGGRTGKAITFFTGDGHERALAGELAKVLREGGFDCEALRKFPMTIRKKEHGAYGAFFRDDIPVPKGPTKIVF